MCEKCPEKVDELISNEMTQFTSDDRDWLEELPEDMLDKFVPKAITVNKAWDVIKKQAKPEEYLTNIPEEVRLQINAEAKEKEERQTIVQNILTNSDWTQEELDGMSLNVLKKLEATKTPEVVNYAVVAGRNQKQATGPAPMPRPGVKFAS